jgi:S-adenosyl methyltransferase
VAVSEAEGGIGQEWPRYHIDTLVPHAARRYNYWIGGKDHFEADRANGDAIAAQFPTVRIAALENRAFMRRAVTMVARDLGVRQFLDIGTGIPAPNNTHEVAQRIAPDSRVVYVDNDPIVMSHARALMTSTPEGATAYVEADLRDHEKILGHGDLRRILDFSQPIALLLIAIMHFIPEEDDPVQVVARIANALPAGSYLVMSHVTTDFAPRDRPVPPGGVPTYDFVFRSREEITAQFAGMEILPPGLVPVGDWRADDEPGARPTPQDVPVYGAVARIP